jgi:hypothetical protein
MKMARNVGLVDIIIMMIIFVLVELALQVVQTMNVMKRHIALSAKNAFFLMDVVARNVDFVRNAITTYCYTV